MSWLFLGWFLTFSYLPQHEQMLYERVWNPEGVVLAQELGLYAELWDMFKLYTSIKTYEVANFPNDVFFSPFRADYEIGFEFFVRDRFAIGIRHQCDHIVDSRISRSPVRSGLSVNTSSALNGFGSNETEVYVTIRGGSRW